MHQINSKEQENPFPHDMFSLIFPAQAVCVCVLWDERIESKASFTAVMLFYSSGIALRVWSCDVISGTDLFTTLNNSRPQAVVRVSSPLCVKCDRVCFVCFVQNTEHPNPGKKYSARGFPRHCYLPDNEKGRKVRIKISCKSCIFYLFNKFKY